MTPETITVGLEWAKKLKEVGWTQESYFWWSERGEMSCLIDPQREEVYAKLHKGFDRWKPMYVAPTAEEILERLPKFVSAKEILRDSTAEDLNYFLTCTNGRNPTEWIVMYRANDMETADYATCNESSLANAAAACWIYLKEHSLLTP